MDPIVSVIMGSQSDWPTMKHACGVLDTFGIAYETLIVSAHRTPDRMMEYSKGARSRGIKVVIAGAGGAAHLPGMVAGSTVLPVHGVPIQSKALQGMDSLLSIVQMPRGVPTATFSIGEAGAVNAALQAVRVLALSDSKLQAKLSDYVVRQTLGVAETPTEK